MITAREEAETLDYMAKKHTKVSVMTTKTGFKANPRKAHRRVQKMNSIINKLNMYEQALSKKTAIM